MHKTRESFIALWSDYRDWTIVCITHELRLCVFITNSPAPSRINSAELPQRDVTVWEFAIFGYFPCIIRTVRTRSFNHKHKHRKMAIFCYFFSRFFLFLELGIFLFKLRKKNILFGIGNTTEHRSLKRAKKTLKLAKAKFQFSSWSLQLSRLVSTRPN